MDSTVVTSIGYPLNVPNLSAVPVTNPFISPDFATWLAARPNPNAPALLFKRFTETGRRVYDTNYETFQLVAGFKGEFGDGNYSWDAYYSHAETDITEDHPNSVLGSRVQALLDAADGGASVCEGGYNPFGRPNNSQACLNYISLPATNNYGTEQDVFEASVQGKLFSLPADDVRFALTATYREDSFFRDVDPLFTTGDVVSSPALISQPSKSIDVSEVAAELLVPLAKSANLGLGYRYSDYSHVGSVNAYKADLDFRPVESILLRGGFERAVRAPNFNEAFAPVSATAASIGPVPSAGDPCDAGSAERMNPAIAADLQDLCIAQGVPAAIYPSYTLGIVSVAGSFSGNENLDPEQADTITAGVVFTPELGGDVVQNLSVSLDYYSIEIEQAINLNGSGAAILGACFNRDGSNPTLNPNNENCQLISRNSATGIINDIRSTYINTGGFKTSGVDLILNGELHFADMPGYFKINTAMNFLDKFEIAATDGSPFVDYKNTIDASEFPPLSPLPDFKALTTFDYVTDQFSVGVRWRHVGSMDNRTAITNPAASDPGPDTYNVFDLVGNIQLNDSVKLGLGITNLSDKQPFILPPGNYVSGGQDQVGRAYYLRVSANF
nr:TonB-dependent receptor [Pseudomaricurvus alcaniphilus]